MNENSTSITKDNRITIVGTKQSMFHQCTALSFSSLYLPLSKQIEQIFVSATNYNQSIHPSSKKRRSTYWFRRRFFCGHLDLQRQRRRRFPSELARVVFVLIAKKKKKEKRDRKYIREEREKEHTHSNLCLRRKEQREITFRS